MDKKFKLTVDSKLENLSVIGQFIEDTMRQCQIDSAKDVHAFQLSVDEACTNVIEHAYAYNTQGQITVTCSLIDDKFTVTIEDSGAPFDPTTMPDPDINQGLDERRAGGLGIYFMKKLMDEVKYNRVDDKNLLTLTKKIEKEVT
jgi:anti-sigma regulatory factor (Ser/Thr protein kinase)